MRVMCIQSFANAKVEAGVFPEKPPEVGSVYKVTDTNFYELHSGKRIFYYRLEGFLNWYFEGNFAPLEGDSEPVIEEEIEEHAFANLSEIDFQKRMIMRQRIKEFNLRNE